MYDRAKDARAAGYATYAGAPCPTCGNVERHTDSYDCVVCRPISTGRRRKNGNSDERHMNAQALKAARRIGEKFYDRVTPCPKCAEEVGEFYNTLRYTSTGACVECMKRRSARLYNDRPGNERVYSQPLHPMRGKCHHGEELRAVLPELNGKTIFYVNNPEYVVAGYKNRFGTCALCQPDRLVHMRNRMLQDGCPDHLAPTWALIARMNEKSERYPHGYIQEAVRQRSVKNGAKGQTPERFKDAPLPPPLKAPAPLDPALVAAHNATWGKPINLPLPGAPKDE